MKMEPNLLLLYTYKQVERALALLISLTPTGEIRNKLTEANILILSAKEKQDAKEKDQIQTT